MMKTSAKILLALAIAASTLFMFSCTEEDGSLNNPGGDDLLESMNIYLPSVDVDSPVINEASLTEEFDAEGTITFDEISRLENRQKDPNRPDKDERRIRPNQDPLFGILRMLQLDDAQREAVGGLLREHHLCILSVRMEMYEARKDIVDAANVERRAIVASYNAGEITREEAITQLRALSLETRELIQAAMAEVNAREKLIACREELFAAIGDILTEEQLELWNRWLQRMG